MGLTWAGWLLGIPMIIALALAGEAVGIGGSQVLVGAGMGLAVGLLQARVAREFTGRRRAWVVATTAGLALPFLVVDLAGLLGRDLPYSLYWYVLLGGLGAGGWQARLLRSRLRRPVAWVVASVVGWSLAAGSAAIADSWRLAGSIRGVHGLLAYLGVIAAGGLVLGLVTGTALRLLTPRREAA